MNVLRKRLFAAAARYDHYWDLSCDERLRWLVERAYRMGQATCAAPSRGGPPSDRAGCRRANGENPT